jgi:heme/copper-type cytochrome/quinol oxidase subunit 2
MEILDIVGLILAVLSAVGAGISVSLAYCNARAQRRATTAEQAGESAEQCIVPAPVKTWVTLGAISTLVFIGAMALLITRYTEQETNVNIISHRPGDEVQAEEVVRGESEHIPDEATIWVLVQPHDEDRYYPQREVNVIASGSDWSTRAIFPAEGQAYDLLAALAEGDAYATLQAHITRSPDDLTPLEALPGGVTIYDRISVVRR